MKNIGPLESVLMEGYATRTIKGMEGKTCEKQLRPLIVLSAEQRS